MIQRSFWLSCAAVIAATLAAPAQAVEGTHQTESGPIEVTIMADGLSHPWALAFLPDGSALVTERPGQLRLMSPDGALSDPIEGVPEVDARGQGGLLDVALDPDFAENRLVYLSFCRAGRRTAPTRPPWRAAA